jgi:hypothetical protein
MNAPTRLLKTVLILLAASLLLVSVVYAKKMTDFEGAWYSDDLDGSHQWLWITNYHEVYELILFDDLCTACTGTFGVGPSCLVIGSARLTNLDTLKIDSGSLYCYWEEGAEKLEGFNWGAEVFYDSTSDTVQIHDVSWDRSKDKKPDKIIDPITMPKPAD